MGEKQKSQKRAGTSAKNVGTYEKKLTCFLESIETIFLTTINSPIGI